MKKDKLTFGIVLSIVFLLVIGVTYAYFSLVVSGNESASLITTNMGTLSIEYTDGSYINAENIEPEWSQTKTVTVKNTGTLDVNYALIFQKLYNELINEEIEYSATCESDIGSCSDISTKGIEETIPEDTNIEIQGGILITPGETHTYTFTFEFIETGDNQNYNQGKTFYAQLGVNESQPKTYKTSIHLIDSDSNHLVGYKVEYGGVTGTTNEYGTVSLSNLSLPLTEELIIKDDSDVEVTRQELDVILGEVETIDEGKVIANKDLDFFSLTVQLDESNNIDNIDANANTLMNPYVSVQDVAIKIATMDTDEAMEYAFSPEFAEIRPTLEAVLANIPAFWAMAPEITSITFENELNPHDDATYTFDVSKTQNHSVMSYLVPNDDYLTITDPYDEETLIFDETFDLYIQQEGGVVASECVFLFGGIANFGVEGFFFTSSINGVENLNISNATNTSLMFTAVADSASEFHADLSSLDMSNVTTMVAMLTGIGFHGATEVVLGDIGKWDVSNVTDMSHLIYNTGLEYATSFYIGDLTDWDVSNVTNMHELFAGLCPNAPEWYIGDFSDWDVSNVTDMGYMFASESSVNAFSFFDRMSSPTYWYVGDLSGWDVSNVTNMEAMFYGAGVHDGAFDVGDLSGWNTSNVTNMRGMFYKVGSDTALFTPGDIGKWNVSNVTDMKDMFGYLKASSINLDLSDWNTSSVTDMSDMFYSAGYNATTWSIGDISGWDTSKVTDMHRMFYSAGLNATYALDLSGWSVPLVTNYSDFNYNVTDKITAPSWNS